MSQNTTTDGRREAIRQLTNDGQYPVEDWDHDDIDHEELRRLGWTLHEPTSPDRPDYYEHESGVQLVIRDPGAETPRLENAPAGAEPEDSAAYYAAEHLAQTLGATIDEDPVYTPEDGAHAYGFRLTQKPTKPSPQTTVQTLGRHDDLRLAVQVDAAGGEDPTGNYSMVPVHIETGPLDDPEILETVEVRWAEL